MSVQSYRELTVWQRGMDLVEAVYRATGDFPNDEKFGLTSQVRKAAVSIPSNIAEGQGRWSTAEFEHHLSIAHGSLCEVETQLLIAERLKYLSAEVTAPLLETAAEVGRLINALGNSLEHSTRRR
ncbi:MAG: four helix bundle protein [Planctomycetes bacterium]|nr:four helix bundle protein [Planctomycetota bacterium]